MRHVGRFGIITMLVLYSATSSFPARRPNKTRRLLSRKERSFLARIWYWPTDRLPMRQRLKLAQDQRGHPHLDGRREG